MLIQTVRNRLRFIQTSLQIMADQAVLLRRPVVVVLAQVQQEGHRKTQQEARIAMYQVEAVVVLMVVRQVGLPHLVPREVYLETQEGHLVVVPYLGDTMQAQILVVLLEPTAISA